jgi:fumarylacetoacetate (FAA) hydrolase
LEIALMVGREAIDLPADDSALECICAMTIYNDWSARDLQRQEMAVGLGPAKGKDFANAFGPRWVPIEEVMDTYHQGRFDLRMRALINDKEVSSGNANSMYWTWPQILAHASRDTKLMPGDVIGSGTVGTGCILELTPEKIGGWLQPGDRVTLIVDRLGELENQVGLPAPLSTRI